ncbi:phosphonate ABC transporter substrate-binding protein [Siccirubricoccus sp. KC 17139]|uniref:Phosphonate ABC transporter substrate-binding protein n=1 Tax=Siccirubricoccus soli TaxID=2899147 RepID=A0ABT1D8V5_9PROT|nr:phosphonate ABC transporter substrate-binding protein [Siccirubricoccus soli]MCO6418336.1 phosphonate ABC transporter substrate-binding protein [Siccirubricoccus soli]MCP2684471.1 phosphonate ABC transporter substrate-binding protein [Siccirubricoccus soli]
MFTRRLLMGAALAAPALRHAQAQSWKAAYPELVFAIVPSENASGVMNRWTPFCESLSKTLGTKVTLRVANDYAAVIEGQRAGNIHIASYGPASFARALKTGAPVEAFCIEVNEDGTKGYHSVFYVKKDSPYQKVQDLRGKNLGLVDPNSTSGNNVPRFALNKMGINPDQFFGRVIYTGSHENAVIALQQGTVDMCANWWNDENESNLRRMERKGMAKYDDFRIIFKSDQIVNSPMAYLTTLPAELRTAIRTAVLELPKKEPETFNRIYDGKARPWEPVANSAYDPIIELITFVDGLRRQRG